jgi:hypothetical protein
VGGFPERPDSFWKESARLAEIESAILCDTGAVINVAVCGGSLSRPVALGAQAAPRRHRSVKPLVGRYLAKAQRCLE